MFKYIIILYIIDRLNIFNIFLDNLVLISVLVVWIMIL